jgi:hypothetical protein
MGGRYGPETPGSLCERLLVSRHAECEAGTSSPHLRNAGIERCDLASSSTAIWGPYVDPRIRRAPSPDSCIGKHQYHNKAYTSTAGACRTHWFASIRVTSIPCTLTVWSSGNGKRYSSRTPSLSLIRLIVVCEA